MFNKTNPEYSHSNNKNGACHIQNPKKSLTSKMAAVCAYSGVTCRVHAPPNTFCPFRRCPGHVFFFVTVWVSGEQERAWGVLERYQSTYNLVVRVWGPVCCGVGGGISSHQRLYFCHTLWVSYRIYGLLLEWTFRAPHFYLKYFEKINRPLMKASGLES